MKFSRAIVVQVLALVIFDSTARTEPFSYYGVSLPIQESRVVGSNSLSVHIKGETFLVARIGAVRGVLEHILRSDKPQEVLSNNDVHAILVEAARHGDGDTLVAVFGAALRQENYDTLDDFAHFENIERSIMLEDAMRRALLKAPARMSPSRECVARFLAGVSGGTRSGDVAGKDGVCLEQIVNNLLSLMAGGVSPESLISDIERAKKVFSATPSSAWNIAQGVSEALSSLQSSEQFSEVAEAVRARDFLDVLLKKQGEERRLSWLQAVDEKFLEQALARGHLVAACQYLAHVAFESRTSGTHETVARLLASAGKDSALQSCVRDNLPLLQRYAQKDELIAARYTAVLEALVGASLKKRAPEEALEILRGGSGERICGRREREHLLSKVYAEFAKAGSLPHNQGVLETCSGWDRALIAMARVSAGVGLRYPTHVVLAAVVGIVLIVGAVRVGRRWSLQSRQGVRDKERPRWDMFSRSDVPSEYAESLKVIGLKPGATMDEIKYAYREAVKRCHPDLQKQGEAAECSSFVVLTKAYDYLLKWHEEQRAYERG